jgi:hypothetical protein
MAGKARDHTSGGAVMASRMFSPGLGYTASFGSVSGSNLDRAVIAWLAMTGFGREVSDV